ncbi:3-oxoacyl-[acyl-carrier protein] reductase [Thermosporothrix hazakensis]|uniref:3-oxoacyl-[acyl-carrier protein] reductase n=3 Tax=Thermosporothrix TaxID=768650 RepID=A0A326U0N6_THEHA|nr:3-oxoacyl-[acyl-carrier protein] reductase [Thermosporothrix hazakensis]BBH89815.1 beta-ketoacyl-ACP reductase [Thermosporothrix sp. COM3]GCE48003.1 beta-ketoacyl-ACP reductase [Thermosporothrix hazakensis]
MLEGKRVVITGAGRGIGKTLALRFAEQGAHVVVHYAHSEQHARDVVEAIQHIGGQATMLYADLSNPEHIRQLVLQAQHAFGPIDVWVNNAGVSVNSAEVRGLSELDLFQRIMDVDVRGTWLCCRELQQRHTLTEQGCIINIGYDGALKGDPGLPNQFYAMSKGAIIALTRCLAVEFAPHIRVNCIAPGFIENEWAQQKAGQSFRKKITEQIPLQRWGTADDIAGAALFLASSAAAYITGQIIVVNGGRVMY